MSKQRSCGHLPGTIQSYLQSLFSESCSLVMGRRVNAEVVKSKDPKFGEYQCNTAMRFAKELQKKPIEIAKEILEKLPNSPLIQELSVAGPGFINIRLNAQGLIPRVNALIHSPGMGMSAREVLKIIVEFSSPNTAKEMHVGHLRSTIIGDSIARLFEFLGHNVLRLNHIGDWGTSFGMLIAHIKSQPDYSFERISQYTLQDLMRLYKESKKRFDEDPVFKKQAQLDVVSLQSGDLASLKIWEVICSISRKAYQEIYDVLDVRLQERGESFYNPELPKIVAELEEKGLIQVSNGAKCLFVDEFANREGQAMPLMLQKSDGGYTYDTTDMAAIFQRIRQEKADWLIYVVDMGQSLHFDLVFSGAEKAHVLDREKTRADHVPFGLVLGLDGKKFRTRSGETEKLVDLLNEAVEKATIILKERNPDWTPEEQTRIARILGLGAVKYADLSCHRGSDYTFSYDRMLRFEGNTAAFIMYSYVRCESIKRKIALKRTYNLDTLTVENLKEPQEVELALKLAQFSESLEAMGQELLPNRLTEYLFTLAEQFNLFFRDCRVEGDPNEASRLALVHATTLVLKQGLQILGIQVPEKM